jgi:transcriptional regulator with XRE-family HTH domain
MTENKDQNNDYGNRLKQLRGDLGVSQKEFAARLGIAASFLSEIEKGKTRPGYNFLIKLAETFKVSPTWLLLGHGGIYLDPESDNFSESMEFGEQTGEIRDLLIYFRKSPLVRLSVIAFASKFLLNNETIINRDITEQEAKK